jgi:hypothetical protein
MEQGRTGWVQGKGAGVRKGDMSMAAKTLSIMAAAGLLIGAMAATVAQTRDTPGHEMQQKGSKKGEPGASGYAPGHEMQKKGSKMGEPGASGYAPGHEKK